MAEGKRTNGERELKTQEHKKLEVKKNSTKSNCNHWASTASITPITENKNRNYNSSSFGKWLFAAAFAFMNRLLFWPNAQILPCDWAKIHNDFWFIQRDVPLNISPWIRTRIRKYWIPKMNGGKPLLNIQIVFLSFSVERRKMSPEWLKADGFSKDTKGGWGGGSIYSASHYELESTLMRKDQFREDGGTFHTVK